MTQVVLLSKTFGAGGGMFKKGFRKILGKGEILKDFSPSQKAELGPEVVGFIKSLKKGNPYKPLAKDTVYITPHKYPDGEMILSFSLPHGKHGAFKRTCSSAPYTMDDGTVITRPLSIDGIKKAIADIKLSFKKDKAMQRYWKNPTTANKQAVFDLHPTSLRENIEFILKHPKHMKG